MAKQRNILSGNSKRAEFARIIYDLCKSRKQFSYDDVIARIQNKLKPQDGKLVKAEVQEDLQKSKIDYYTELKKAFGDIKDALGDDFTTAGNNRKRKYQYIGEAKDPLGYMAADIASYDFEKYHEFLNDSEGLFPQPWLEYFFRGSYDLQLIKKKKSTHKLIYSSSAKQLLTNIELLPKLYEAIKKKQVLIIDYKPFGKDEEKYTISPHQLREYNGRWHLLGQMRDDKSTTQIDLALDRITKLEIAKDATYTNADIECYKAYENRVGISHIKGNKPEKVILRIHSEYMFGLFTTKPFHPSQKTLTQFDKYGEIELTVEINKELKSNILHYGPDVEVMAPEHLREEIADNIKRMGELYS